MNDALSKAATSRPTSPSTVVPIKLVEESGTRWAGAVSEGQHRGPPGSGPSRSSSRARGNTML